MVTCTFHACTVDLYQATRSDRGVAWGRGQLIVFCVQVHILWYVVIMLDCLLLLQSSVDEPEGSGVVKTKADKRKEKKKRKQQRQAEEDEEEEKDEGKVPDEEKEKKSEQTEPSGEGENMLCALIPNKYLMLDHFLCDSHLYKHVDM